MLRYAITDGSQSSADPVARARMRATVRRWAAEGVDFVQLREKSLPVRDLIGLCVEFVHELRAAGSRTRLLVNARADVAVAVQADGVHLTARPGELTPAQVRAVYARCLPADAPPPVISISCHTVEQVARAHAAGADLILFGPVFEKAVGGERVLAGSGLELLRAAVQAAQGTPVLALGGITAETSPLCLHAGASGVAGIRLFA